MIPNGSLTRWFVTSETRKHPVGPPSHRELPGERTAGPGIPCLSAPSWTGTAESGSPINPRRRPPSLPSGEGRRRRNDAEDPAGAGWHVGKREGPGLEVERCPDDPRERAHHSSDCCAYRGSDDRGWDTKQYEPDDCAKYGPDQSAELGVSRIGVFPQGIHLPTQAVLKSNGRVSTGRATPAAAVAGFHGYSPRHRSVSPSFRARGLSGVIRVGTALRTWDYGIGWSRSSQTPCFHRLGERRPGRREDSQHPPRRSRTRPGRIIPEVGGPSSSRPPHRSWW